MQPLVEHAQAAVNGVAKHWHYGPSVAVVQDAGALPWPAPPDTRGAYSPRDGSAFVVAAQSRAEMLQVLAHEAVGHHGLRALFGPGWRHFMTAISDGVRDGDPLLRLLAERIRDVYVDESGACDLTARAVADEVAAHVAALLVCGDTGLINQKRRWRKVCAATYGRFLREWLQLSPPVGRYELEGALLLAERRMRKGRLMDRLFPQHRYTGRMETKKPMGASTPPRDWDESKRWLEEAEQQENWFSRAVDEWTIVLGVFGLPLIFIALALLWISIIMDFGAWLRGL